MKTKKADFSADLFIQLLHLNLFFTGQYYDQANDRNEA